MTERGKRVYALLRSINSWLPGPATWRQNPLCQREDSGEAPSMSVDCQTCAGKGMIGKGVKRRCARCRGRGTRVVDAYTEREVGSEDGGLIQRRRDARCDGCGGDGVHRNGRRCHRCSGRGTISVAEARGRDSELERLCANERIRAGLEGVAFSESASFERRSRLYEQGSYDHADQALSELGLEAPSRYSALLRHVIYDDGASLSPALERQIAETVEWLAKRMPDPIRVPRWALIPERCEKGKGRWANGQAQGVRNDQIRKLADEGRSPTWLADEFGLSRQRVQQIIGASKLGGRGREAREAAA